MVFSFKTACGSNVLPSSPQALYCTLYVRFMYATVQNIIYAAVVDRCRCPSSPDPGRNPVARLCEENGRYQAKTLSICAPAHRAPRGNGDNRLREELPMHATRFLSRL